MRYLSVCSGIEAATVAWKPLGWEAAAFAEIEQHPSAVLAHHYPDVPNHGDFTTIKGEEYGTIDLIVGGTPCQSFSLSGLRTGMDDLRGQLSIEFVKLAKRSNARWIVWENVTGVLSADDGRAFASFLGALAHFGYGFAYRVFNTQYVRTRRFPNALPQMRRRLFLIGYYGDWRPPAAVLFDKQAVQIHTKKTSQVKQKSHPGTGQDDRGVCKTRLIKAFSQEMGINECWNNEIGKTLQTDKDCIIFITESPDGNRIIRYASSVERERLQGFPDNYTDVKHKGKPISHTARIKMIGNSMSVNVMEWIGERIDQVEKVIKNVQV